MTMIGLRGLVAITTLAAAPALGAEKIRVLVLALNASDAKLQQVANGLAEQVLTELQHYPELEVIGASDVAAALGIERQKEMFGCSSDSNACIAEVSGAMAAKWLISGSLTRAGKASRIDFKLIRASDGHALAREGRTFQEESEVFELMSAVLKPLAEQMLREAGAPGEVLAASTGSRSSRVLPMTLTFLGAGAAVTGAILIGIANVNAHPALTLNVADARSQVQGAGNFGTAGGIALGVGLAVATAGLLWWLLGTRPESGSALIGAMSWQAFAAGSAP